MKTIIHVNKQLIAQNINRPDNKKLPVYTVKTGKNNAYGYGVEILGPSRLVDVRDACQLSCGARAWIETDSKVKVIGKMSFKDVKKLREQN